MEKLLARVRFCSPGPANAPGVTAWYKGDNAAALLELRGVVCLALLELLGVVWETMSLPELVGVGVVRPRCWSWPMLLVLVGVAEPCTSPASGRSSNGFVPSGEGLFAEPPPLPLAQATAPVAFSEAIGVAVRHSAEAPLGVLTLPGPLAGTPTMGRAGVGWTAALPALAGGEAASEPHAEVGASSVCQRRAR